MCPVYAIACIHLPFMPTATLYPGVLERACAVGMSLVRQDAAHPTVPYQVMLQFIRLVRKGDKEATIPKGGTKSAPDVASACNQHVRSCMAGHLIMVEGHGKLKPGGLVPPGLIELFLQQLLQYNEEVREVREQHQGVGGGDQREGEVPEQQEEGQHDGADDDDDDVDDVDDSQLPQNLNDLKVPELRAALQARGASSTGTKATLVDRLQEFVNARCPEDEGQGDEGHNEGHDEGHDEGHGNVDAEDGEDGEDGEQVQQQVPTREEILLLPALTEVTQRIAAHRRRGAVHQLVLHTVVHNPTQKGRRCGEHAVAAGRGGLPFPQRLMLEAAQDVQNHMLSGPEVVAPNAAAPGAVDDEGRAQLLRDASLELQVAPSQNDYCAEALEHVLLVSDTNWP